MKKRTEENPSSPLGRPHKEVTPGFPLSDESARESAPVEWWFVQGVYSGQGTGTRHFMASLFRFRVSDDEAPPEHGFSLLLSVLEPGVKPEISARVDRRLVDWAARRIDDYRGSNVEEVLIDICKRETLRHGPPRPVKLSQGEASLSNDPLSIKLDDYSFRQSESGFELEFAEPQSGRVCSFRLSPEVPRKKLTLQKDDGAPIDSVCYSYPSLGLDGTVDGRPVKGEAWLDHQWGEENLSRDESGTRVIGWDWLGFNFDDGSSGLVTVQKDAASGERRAGLAALWPRIGPESTTRDFSLEPVRHWVSGVTRVRYPVAWRLRVPALEVDLTFEPLWDDQEILFFDMTVTVWEGAGKVTGTIKGRPVSGRARGEFYGYGLVADSREYLDRFTDSIQGHLEEFLPRIIDDQRLEQMVGKPHWRHDPQVYNKTIAGPVWDLIDRKGKSWRPVFILLLLETLGKLSKPYEALLSVPVELAHTGALIIDDVEDNSDIRRGKECIHLRYGVDVAINAGTTLFFLPTRLIDSHPLLSSDQKLALHSIAMNHIVRAHLGQATDIHLSRDLTRETLEQWRNGPLLQKIMQMYAFKTGTAVIGAAESVAVIAEADDALREEAMAFARDFGVSFQIVDDVLNFSESPEWRKTCGEDLREGKITYVILRAIELLQDPERERLVEILCSARLRTEPSTHREGIDLVRISGALAASTEEAMDLFKKAWDRFADQVPPSWPKWMLYAVCSKLVNLAHDA